jgi:hypothetical protein
VLWSVFPPACASGPRQRAECATALAKALAKPKIGAVVIGPCSLIVALPHKVRLSKYLRSHLGVVPTGSGSKDHSRVLDG